MFKACIDRSDSFIFQHKPVHVLQNRKKYIYLGSHIRVLSSSFPLHWKPNILLVNYDSWWQHQMSVRELRHDRPSGRFSNSRGLSASVSFLSSPPSPRSFTYAIFRTVFDSRSFFFAPKPHGNACYAGYWQPEKDSNRPISSFFYVYQAVRKTRFASQQTSFACLAHRVK